jgi:hypothetical protein
MKHLFYLAIGIALFMIVTGTIIGLVYIGNALGIWATIIPMFIFVSYCLGRACWAAYEVGRYD